MSHAILVALPAILVALGAAAAQPVRFVAFADMPYCRASGEDACAAEVRRVERLMAAIVAAHPAFSIFLGDTKAGAEACSDAVILRALDWMGRADHPLLYTPGDNEWGDCWQPRA